MSTNDKNNWVIDRRHSDCQNGDNHIDNVFKYTISSKVSQLKSEIEDLYSNINLSGSADRRQNNEVAFVLPRFNTELAIDKRNYFGKSVNWIGFIEEINSDSFSAKLYDDENSESYEVAEFDVEEVSESDKELLKVGASFYWSVGFATENGQVKKQSLIRFRRRFLEISEFDNIVDESREMSKKMKWD